MDYHYHLIQQMFQTFWKHRSLHGTRVHPNLSIYISRRFVSCIFRVSCHIFSLKKLPTNLGRPLFRTDLFLTQDWSLPRRFRRHTQLDTWRNTCSYQCLGNPKSTIYKWLLCQKVKPVDGWSIHVQPIPVIPERDSWICNRNLLCIGKKAPNS